MDKQTFIKVLKHHIKGINPLNNGDIFIANNENYQIVLKENYNCSTGYNLVVYDNNGLIIESTMLKSIRDIFAKVILYCNNSNFNLPEPIYSMFDEYAHIPKDSPITITLVGSYRGERFLKMKQLVETLEAQGINVYYPKKGDLDESEFGFFENDETNDPTMQEFEYFARGSIRKCDAIIFCDYDNHLGSMSSNELYGFGYLCFMPCYLLEPLKDFDNNILAYMKDIGCLKIGIDEFFNDFGINPLNNLTNNIELQKE